MNDSQKNIPSSFQDLIHCFYLERHSLPHTLFFLPLDITLRTSNSLLSHFLHHEQSTVTDAGLTKIVSLTRIFLFPKNIVHETLNKGEIWSEKRFTSVRLG